MSDDKAKVALPRWQSHRQFAGDKIVAVAERHVGIHIRPERWTLACGAVIDVSTELAARVPRNRAPIGGYYVRYDDGFESWSPAEPFESGYTRLDADPATE